MDLETKQTPDALKHEVKEPYNDQPEEAYNFPFKPYDIQLKLMKVAYDTYENSKFALLESPTGTGKSLSLICSSITWLLDHQRRVKQNLEFKKEELIERIEELKREEETSGDWLTVQTKRRDVDKELASINKDLEKIVKLEQKKDARRHAKLHNIPLDHYAVITGKQDKNIDQSKNNNDENKSMCDGDESIVIDEEEDENIESRVKEINEDDVVRPKVYYASRTHSQLSQFINEIKRTKFADMDAGPTIKVAPLASRAHLCINPEVVKLKDSSAINERCAEMQRETKPEKKCPFIKAKQVSMLKEDILSSVQDIEDIVSRGRVMGSCPYYAARMSVTEAEVVVLPYNNLLHHETRKMSSLDLKDSIVIVDEAHNILETICAIHSAPISGQHLLAGHTILSRYYKKFHNMMSPKNAETIKSIVLCLTVLIRYLDNPKRHLKEFECAEIVNLDINEDKSDKISVVIQGANSDKQTKRPQQMKHEELMIDVMKFIGAANIERFNIFKIIDYFNRSQLARKLIGFYRQDNTIDLSLDLHAISNKTKDNSRLKEDNAATKLPPKKKRKGNDKQPIVVNDEKSTSHALEQTSLNFLKKSNPDLNIKQDVIITSYPIYTLVEFLRSLTNLAHDGKVLTDYVENNFQLSMLKFILLNPSSQFKQMAEEARSIILAGGTMQPFNEFVDLLFGPLGIRQERLTLFSCGHVIKPDQIFVATLATGCTGKPLELSFKTRSSFETIDEIGRTIFNLSNVVPGGMVCFLPSYDYEQICFNRWTQIGVIRNIETRSKQVFREPKVSSQLKPVLEEYSRVVKKTKGSNRGAMLLCVVGGKMSEGINFNDDLGRCVVMIGLPYANIKSGELQQKMRYYDKSCRMASNSSQTTSAGQQYYENLCIKGINQSIGRAVRHRNDYAAIILLDRRFSVKNSIRNGLPEWIRNSLTDFDKFGSMLVSLKGFYNHLADKQ